jgi:hypothetical protein
MRYRREQNHTDTAERPDIEMFVDQPNVVPVNVSEESKWTKTNFVFGTGGILQAIGVAQNSYIEREIPGVLAGHVYRVVVTISGGDVVTITMGGITLEVGASAGVNVYDVRPTDGAPLRFEYVDVAAGSFTVDAITVEAIDPIELDLIHEIKKF